MNANDGTDRVALGFFRRSTIRIRLMAAVIGQASTLEETPGSVQELTVAQNAEHARRASQLALRADWKQS